MKLTKRERRALNTMRVARPCDCPWCRATRGREGLLRLPLVPEPPAPEPQQGEDEEERP